MNKINIIKQVGSLVISTGIGAIVGNAVKATTPADVRTLKKICIGVGSFILGSMASELATRYAEEKIDHAVYNIKQMVNNGDLD